ncbi:S-adenosyl-L-methionine-dependent methyltransferase [Histomonas meleagridis]|uniref:S-adenosyl-L-methionine-dependent methyltransferase n=1 Tax=Histomonas meleagridis TaxID=135588 RepID=UPI00355A8347|nr:S-adenosyl-L-methionine-dependent methyltransferase [Histomonas meleagridis]KAH0802403.1 S-adenosyl-L-methionine-dependent methyltransferase [Histomonas meleagridis]
MNKTSEEIEEKFVFRPYKSLCTHYANNKYDRWKTIEQFIFSLPPNSMILDIGCGTGRYLSINNKIIDIGIDPIFEQCKFSHEQHPNSITSEICGNGLMLPFQDNTFDHVICIHVIHHFPSKDHRIKCLKEICRVLRVGGTALVSAWGINCESSRSNEQDQIVPWKLSQEGIDPNVKLDRFYHFFKEGEFSELANEISNLELLEEVNISERIEAAFLKIPI